MIQAPLLNLGCGIAPTALCNWALTSRIDAELALYFQLVIQDVTSPAKKVVTCSWTHYWDSGMQDDAGLLFFLLLKCEGRFARPRVTTVIDFGLHREPANRAQLLLLLLFWRHVQCTSRKSMIKTAHRE